VKARELVTGRIVEILANSKGDRAVVVLDTFQVILSARHDIYGMPMLARRHDETTYIVIRSTVCPSGCPPAFNCLQHFRA
jgi:hypothetical protein